jgi:hypothetical protein
MVFGSERSYSDALPLEVSNRSDALVAEELEAPAVNAGEYGNRLSNV